jgi:uncharacterized protein (TIGR02145 family)
MKQFYLLVSFILVFNSNHLLAQNDSIYFWKGGIKINQLSIKTADLDSITFKRPAVTDPNTVIIGTQTWTTKNLDLATYSDGTVIPQVTDPTAWANLTTGAWCYYNNDSAKGATYGKLYNWYAVAGIHDTDPNTPNKKLAPTGYHIPSDAEWTTLTTYLEGESVAGGKMKATGTSLWNTPNGQATNSSGFSGLPGGCRFINGTFNYIGSFGYWWSSSEANTTNAWVRDLDYASGYANRGSDNKVDGLSVRCLVGEPAVVAVAPTITTTAVSSIGTITASSGGVITADGGASVTQRGLVWSTTTNPTIALSTKTEDGIEIGTYTSALSGLVANTTYYVRAYATNSAGTGYGAQLSFATLPAVTDPNTVTIGTQTWTTKNLDVATYRNGEVIPEVQDATAWASLTTGAWCHYDNNPANDAIYGKLYNWYAVNDSRGLAPSGFHVPTDIELTAVTNMKDPAGFAGLPGGSRNNLGIFYNIGLYGSWWSSSEYITTRAWYRYPDYHNVFAYRASASKSYGFSVRCLRD